MAIMLYKSVEMNGIKFRPKIQNTGIDNGHYKNGYKVEFDDVSFWEITIYTHAHNKVVESVKFLMNNGELLGYYNYLLPGADEVHEFIKKEEVKQEFKNHWSKNFVLPQHHKYFTFS